MARTALALTALTGNAAIDIPGDTTIDQGNGMSIAIPGSSGVASADASHLVLMVKTTNGADKTVTVKGNTGTTPSLRGGTAGTDLTVTAHAASGGCYIGPLDTARFAQNDGSVNVDFASGITGSIMAFMWPSRW